MDERAPRWTRIAGWLLAAAILFLHYWVPWKTLQLEVGDGYRCEVRRYRWSCEVISSRAGRPIGTIKLREDIFEHPTALIVHGSTKTVLCLSILDTTYCAFIAELNSPLPTSSVPPRLQEACSSSTLQLRACRKAEAQAAMDFIKQADDATFVALLIGNAAELRPAAESRGWTREELAKLLLLATAGHESRHPVLQNAKPHLRAVD